MNTRDVIGLFSPAPGTVYLDTATYGLPPAPTIRALEQALRGWRGGTAHWIDDWDSEAEVCRRLFARLIHGSAGEVSLMPAVSVATGIVATGVPAGGQVLLAEGDFTSVIYPFLDAQRRGLLRVREAPLARLAEAVTKDTSMVAVSLVQSADGAVADLEAIGAAARDADARLYVDGSQALGAMPVDVSEMAIDYLSCGAYKWLCCPRGVAFLYVREALWDAVSPVVASWRAGDDPYGRFYGSPLALAADAARFDVSLAWHPWVGARPSLETLLLIGDDERFALARAPVLRLAELLELPPPGSSILSVPVTDSARAGEALHTAGIKASVRSGGQIRIASHFYNSVAEAERAAEVLKPHLALRRQP
ncbi:MAG: aminotransferase class V-fold PLP-dependent enzyme [bacterium]|nr:aminotransferase class V-fold PLP-dependent enzyme [bacterium]